MMRDAGVPQAAVDQGPEAMVSALTERLGGDWRAVGEHLRRASAAARDELAPHAALDLARALSEDAERIRAAAWPGGRTVRDVRVA
ncbi:MAG TPA: hypothetical protein VHY48_12230 [Acidobacteriaceae bacterium]|jgi:hypothetical protein|nr:hypothetical protein [Acidobacteriaceae bacterium]